MTDAISDLSGKLGLDTTDFKTAIAGANRELRVIESGFRASAAALGDWTKSADGLESRVETLGRAMEVQSAKVAALRQEYERIAGEQGDSSKVAQEMLIRLNKETETLGKMQAEVNKSERALQEMGEASEEAGGKVDNLADQEDKATKNAIKMGDVMKGLGTVMKGLVTAVAGVGAAVAGVGAAITGLVLTSADAAGELVDLSAKTGISTTQLQEMAYAGEQLGVSVDTIAGSMARLTRGMGDARSGTGPAAEAFAALGVSVGDANGNLRDNQYVFADVIDALQKIPNEAERDALAMEIFGKSAQELNPLIQAGSDGIADLAEQAHEMGAVMSEEAVSALESFGDELAALQAGLKGTAGELAAAFLPAFQGLTEAARGYLGEFSEIVRGADGDLVTMATGIGGLIGRMITDIAQQAPQMLQAGLSIMTGIGNAILQALPTLIPAVVQMVSSLVGFIVQALPMLMDAGVQILLALVSGLLPQLPMLIEAGLQMIITLVQGIAAALPTLIPVIAEVIPQIVIILIENLPLLIDAALQLIIALAQGLMNALPVLIPYVPKIIQAIFNAIITSLPMIAEAAGQLIATLAMGLITSIPQIIVAMAQIGTSMQTYLTDLAKTMLGLGGNLVSGIWQGILERWDWLKKNFASLVQSLIDDILGLIGNIGGGGEEGEGEGESEQATTESIGQSVSNVLSGALTGAQGALQTMGFSGTAGLAGAGSGMYTPITVNIQAAVADDVDIERLAMRVADRIQRR